MTCAALLEKGEVTGLANAWQHVRRSGLRWPTPAPSNPRRHFSLPAPCEPHPSSYTPDLERSHLVLLLTGGPFLGHELAGPRENIEPGALPQPHHVAHSAIAARGQRLLGALLCPTARAAPPPCRRRKASSAAHRSWPCQRVVPPVPQRTLTQIRPESRVPRPTPQGAVSARRDFLLVDEHAVGAAGVVQECSAVLASVLQHCMQPAGRGPRAGGQAHGVFGTEPRPALASPVPAFGLGMRGTPPLQSPEGFPSCSGGWPGAGRRPQHGSAPRLPTHNRAWSGGRAPQAGPDPGAASPRGGRVIQHHIVVRCAAKGVERLGSQVQRSQQGAVP